MGSELRGLALKKSCIKEINNPPCWNNPQLDKIYKITINFAIDLKIEGEMDKIDPIKLEALICNNGCKLKIKIRHKYVVLKKYMII